MSQPLEPETNSELRARNLELEEQLAAAGREDEAQDEVETALRETLLYLGNIVDTVREPMLVLDRTLRVRTASRAFYQTFRVSKEETERRLIHNLGDGQWDIPALRTLLKEVLQTEKSFQDFEVVHDFPGGEWRRIQRAKGYHAIVVNGEVTFRDGKCTGATPGRLLRQGR